MQHDLVDLGGDGRLERDVSCQRGDLLHSRTGTARDVGGSSALLFAETVERKIVLRARGVRSVERRAIGGFDLVVALLRNQAVLVERADTLESRFREICRGNRTLPIGARDAVRPPAASRRPEAAASTRRRLVPASACESLAWTSGLSSVTSMSPGLTASPSRTCSLAMRPTILGEISMYRPSIWPCNGATTGGWRDTGRRR